MTEIPATFPTICSNTVKFPRVEIAVTKTKTTTDIFTDKVTVKIGGICPKCNQLHTNLIVTTPSKYAAVYPTAADQKMIIASDLMHPQHEDAL